MNLQEQINELRMRLFRLEGFTGVSLQDGNWPATDIKGECVDRSAMNHMEGHIIPPEFVTMLETPPVSKDSFFRISSHGPGGELYYCGLNRGKDRWSKNLNTAKKYHDRVEANRILLALKKPGERHSIPKIVVYENT